MDGPRDPQVDSADLEPSADPQSPVSVLDALSGGGSSNDQPALARRLTRWFFIGAGLLLAVVVILPALLSRNTGKPHGQVGQTNPNAPRELGDRWSTLSRLLNRVVNENPQNINAWFRLGLVEIRQARLLEKNDSHGKASPAIEGHLNRARECFTNVYNLDPHYKFVAHWLLDHTLRLGDWKKARVYRDAVSKKDPKHRLVILAWEIIPTVHQKDVTWAKKLLEKPTNFHMAKIIERLTPLHEQEPADLDILEPLTQSYAHLGMLEDGPENAFDATSAKLGECLRWKLINAQFSWALLCHQYNVGSSEGMDPNSTIEPGLKTQWANEIRALAQEAAKAPHLQTDAERLLALIDADLAVEPDVSIHFVSSNQEIKNRNKKLVESAERLRKQLAKQPNDVELLIKTASVLSQTTGGKKEALRLLDLYHQPAHQNHQQLNNLRRQLQRPDASKSDNN